MFNALFRNITNTEKNDAVESIIQHATPRLDFFLMLILSAAMAAFGVILNSVVILVGSMLIAPLLFPLFSFALGIVVVDEKLIARSVYTILKSIGFALTASFVIGLLFSVHGETLSPSLVAYDTMSFAYALVAAISGFAGAFAISKPHLNETLPGVAVSVSLVPPLAVAGVALALFNWTMFSNALLMFFVNVIGVVFSAMIVFSLLQFAKKKTVATDIVKQEEKIVKNEVQEK